MKKKKEKKKKWFLRVGLDQRKFKVIFYTNLLTNDHPPTPLISNEISVFFKFSFSIII